MNQNFNLKLINFIKLYQPVLREKILDVFVRIKKGFCRNTKNAGKLGFDTYVDPICTYNQCLRLS